MKMTKIYTKTGDKGTTSLVGGVRVSKADIRLDAYGTIDELNSFIGLLISVMKDAEHEELLRFVQHKLFSLASYLATDLEKTTFPIESHISVENVQRLEQAIDEINASLPSLAGFILPGGSYPASVCHVCRTVCRRAERRIQALEESLSYELEEQAKCFVNRLSDYLFVLSRRLNNLTDESEIYWDKRCE